ncbi:TorD/DmsD family molecular chaperone [Natranaerobius thermophilus]|nr:molecular chaperone TorD family protein [Natranaerobius thermophilus]
MQEENSLARWAFYDFFSKALYEPEEDMLKPQFCKLIQEANQAFPAVEFSLIDKFCKIIDEQDGLQELLVEYSKLFVGPSKLLAPPYESYYRDRGRVMGESTMNVKKFYQQAGMEVLQEIKEPQDHIAIEMNFLAQLYRIQTQLLNSGDNDKADQILTLAKDFYLKHPATWIDQFTYLVKSETKHSFYYCVAEILELFHKYEMNYYKTTVFSC